MTHPDALAGWVRRYRDAWESNDPAAIADLFSSDAEYLTEPFTEPWQGREEIVRNWLERKDEPGTTTFEFEVVATAAEPGFVRAVTAYRDPPRRYWNLWEVTLDGEQRCSRFVEWWMQQAPRQ